MTISWKQIKCLGFFGELTIPAHSLTPGTFRFMHTPAKSAPPGDKGIVHHTAGELFIDGKRCQGLPIENKILISDGTIPVFPGVILSDWLQNIYQKWINPTADPMDFRAAVRPILSELEISPRLMTKEIRLASQAEQKKMFWLVIKVMEIKFIILNAPDNIDTKRSLTKFLTTDKAILWNYCETKCQIESKPIQPLATDIKFANQSDRSPRFQDPDIANNHKLPWLTQLRRVGQKHQPALPIQANQEGRAQTSSITKPSHAGLQSLQVSKELFSDLQKQWLKQGVVCLPMADALENYSDIIQQYLGTLIKAEDYPVAALSQQHMQYGTFVYVPDQVQLSIPVQNTWAQTGRSPWERNLIIIGEGASIKFVEGCQGQIDFSEVDYAPVTEIFLGPGSSLDYISSNYWEHSPIDYGIRKVKMGDHAKCNWTRASMGTCTSRSPWQSKDGFIFDGSDCELVLDLAIASHQKEFNQMIIEVSGQQGEIKGRTVLAALDSSKSILRFDCDEAQRNKLDSIIITGITQQHPKQLELIGFIKQKKEMIYELEKIEPLHSHDTWGMTLQERNQLRLMGLFNPIIRAFPDEYGIEIKRWLDKAIS
tara:strand:- start:267 stop:2054 length:1788 start_codon:yes stop_codon:yes gene_type:complete